VGTEYEKSTNWNDPVTMFLTLGHQYPKVLELVTVPFIR